MTRLSSFIIGGKVPHDWYSFAHGINKGLCLFCMNPHDSIQFDCSQGKVIGTYNEYARPEFVDICSSCAAEIHSTSLYQEHGSEVVGRELVNYYLSTGKLPEDVFQHLYKGIKQDHCTFCKKKIMGGNPFKISDKHYTVIQVPIPNSEVCYPAGVLVCAECKKLIDQFGYGKQVEGIYYHDTCAICAGQYPIEDQVLRGRQANNSLTKHVCGGCWVTRLNNKYDTPHMGYLTCNICGISFIQDFTQVIDRKISSVIGGKTYCFAHIGLSVNGEREFIGLTRAKNIYIRVFRSLKGNCYEVVKYSHTDDLEILFKSPYHIKDTDELIVMAHEKLSEIIENDSIPIIKFPEHSW